MNNEGAPLSFPPLSGQGLRPVSPSTPLAPLDPARVSELAQDAVRALMREGESENTLRSYRSALKYWAGWYALRYGGPIRLPVSEAVVLQFVVDHAERSTPNGLACELPPELDAALVEGGYKQGPGAPSLATLTHRLSVLSKLHQLKDLPNPCHGAQLRELLSRIRRAYARRGAAPARKPALTREPLEALLATCDDSLRGLRDRALLLFAWASGGRRRSEVTQATCENVRKTGERAYAFTLLHSKTNQAGADRPENVKPVVGVAADALEAWLRASGIASGPIFRRIRRGDRVAEPLSPAAVRDIVVKRCALAGIETPFSAHSIRSGFVTEAARQEVSLAETMAMTGHASVKGVATYFRADPAQARAARLLEEAPKRD
ncbi:site-specific integrase [Caldimonas tepidiphila]|uniref:site-specific integrase n=1 Tax=Caldimonas tepidiphila TaxID=2315841 RepID=UPI000E5B01A3|nr:site-specific integrase [Caldimonas tepidiphila]